MQLRHRPRDLSLIESVYDRADPFVGKWGLLFNVGQLLFQDVRSEPQVRPAKVYRRHYSEAIHEGLKFRFVHLQCVPPRKGAAGAVTG